MIIGSMVPVPPGLRRYGRAADRSAAVVIGEYSTSFGLATRLLPRGQRRHIRNVYALVRLADEVVDGVATEAGLDPAAVRSALDALERDTAAALASGYSTNLVVHAFAVTARAVGIDTTLTGPFFHSMRMDLERSEYTPEAFAEYIDGSAEVVGLMCLRVFLSGLAEPPSWARTRLEHGARRLGAAFQKINFLRDLAADADGLGRAYFPGIEPRALDEATKLRLLDDIDGDLRAAIATLSLLPKGARRAVALATGLFGALTERLRRTPADRLRTTRIRVPDPVKVLLMIRAILGLPPVRR